MFWQCDAREAALEGHRVQGGVALVAAIRPLPKVVKQVTFATTAEMFHIHDDGNDASDDAESIDNEFPYVCAELDRLGNPCRARFRTMQQLQLILRYPVQYNKYS